MPNPTGPCSRRVQCPRRCAFPADRAPLRAWSARECESRAHTIAVGSSRTARRNWDCRSSRDQISRPPTARRFDRVWWGSAKNIAVITKGVVVGHYRTLQRSQEPTGPCGEFRSRAPRRLQTLRPRSRDVTLSAIYKCRSSAAEVGRSPRRSAAPDRRPDALCLKVYSDRPGVHPLGS